MRSDSVLLLVNVNLALYQPTPTNISSTGKATSLQTIERAVEFLILNVGAKLGAELTTICPISKCPDTGVPA